MKKQIVICLLLISIQALFGQVIITEPTLPKEDDFITITFNATQATRKDLVGYKGDLYTHTGVNTNYGNWQHVIEGWGNNNTQPKLDSIGTDLYELVIGKPRDFYNITDSNEKILSLNFVFRSSDSKLQTEDLFVEIFEDQLSVSILQPSNSQTVIQMYDTLSIKAASNKAKSLSLFFDDSLLIQTNLDTVSYSLVLQKEGKNYIVAVAEDSLSNTAADSVQLVIRGEAIVENLPEGIIHGINYTSESSVTLALFAPFKEFVYVIGDFNNWEIAPDYYMKRTPNDSIYWLAIDGLSNGVEYAFQYLVDGNLRIADPYTEKVLDPWHDNDISSATYPNLKPYPSGKTSEITATFQINSPQYEWQSQDYVRPKKHKLVIYELLIRDFIEAHDFSTLIDTLDYLTELGINAIELMPINEFEGNSSWGYNPSFYFAVDKYYGPEIDFKRFVDECHQRDIAVIIDMVLNHSYGQSPLVRLYDHGDHTTSPENPWYNEEHSFTNTDAHWGYDFDHESPATQYFIDRVNRHWITEYKIDGFRFDFTKGFTNNKKYSDDPWGSRYDADRVRLLKRMADRIWAADSSVYVIMEHLAENSEEKVLSDYGMLLWGNCNYNYAQASMGYTNGSDFSWGFYQTRGWANPHLVSYMESHDEERLMYKNLTWGNYSGDYKIKELNTALNRQKLVNALFLTLPGPKMIWQFGELGYDYSIDYEGRLGEKPAKWDYFADPARLNLYKTVKALLKLRDENAVFTSPDTDVQLSLGSKIKRITLLGDMNVLVLGNIDVVTVEAVPNFPYGGMWYDYFNGDSIYVEFTSTPITLAPGEFHIYTTEKLDTPEIGIISEIDTDIPEMPREFKVHNNYPNPFNAVTTLRYDLEKESNIRINIYDLIGREVYTENRLKQSAGKYSFTWNGTDHSGRILHSGVYFLVLNRSGNHLVQKVTLLK